MRETRDYPPIRPERVAVKLQRIRNFEYDKITEEMIAQPRLAEMLWFLAFVSRSENYPGGLRKFARDLVAQSGDLLGTRTMQAHGAAPYPESLHELIHYEIPNEHRWWRQRSNVAKASDFLPIEGWDERTAEEIDAQADREFMEEQGERARIAAEKEKTVVMMAGEIADLCRRTAEEELADYLVNLCERPDVRFTRPPSALYDGGGRAPWYFVKVADAILRFMDRRKTEIAATIAETAVSREIFHWLGKARSTGRSVVISGNSRFGKTEAVRAWAGMNPGIARIVETPSSGGEGEMLRAVARSLGIDFRPNQRGHDLRSQIEFVLQQSRLMLIFEEASFLYPATFSKNTMPARLNWVRRSVMDAGLPCAFIWTPQTHRDARSRFLKATGFAIEQFDGRILRTVNLPTEIPREDLLAIARIHFRGLPESYCEYVVSKAAATERNYCSDVSNIAALAYSNAEDAGRAVPKLEDIKAAIADVLPVAAELPPKAAPRASRTRPASPMQTPCTARESRPPTSRIAGDSGVVEQNDFQPADRAPALSFHPV